MADNVSKNEKSRIGCHVWGVSPVSVRETPTFAEVGCRWVRSTRPMQMEIVATGPSRYDFANNGEEAVNLAVENGMSIMGILDGRWGNERGPNLLQWASPIWQHLDLWGEFVTAAVEYYKDRVKFWEVINEPPFFWWYPTEEGVVSGEGTNPPLKRAPIWAYADLLKATAKAVRAADPEAKIVMGSGFSDGLFMKKLYELGCADSFDIASVHYLNCKHPDDFARAYRRQREVMSQFGDDHKQLWDTENGPGGAVIGQSVKTPGDYEALYNIYRHCFTYENGLDRYFWFNPVHWKENGVGHAASSTRDESGQLTPAYEAMKNLYSLLGDGELLASRHFDNEVHLYVFDGPAGPVSIAWSTAPAVASISGGFEAKDYLGRPLRLKGDLELNGKPLFIHGDLSESGFDPSVKGSRETVVSPMKQPAADTAVNTCPKVAGEPGIGDPQWESIRYVATKDSVPTVEQKPHFCLLTSSVSADLQLAYDDEALYLRVKTYDERFDPAKPTGLVQFTVRDQNPDVLEWTYFYNSYGLFNLFASDRGPMFLRYEHLLLDEYPSGVVNDADVKVVAESDGLRFWARVPWHVLGPCRPGKNNPFLMMFSFNRADNILDVPEGDEPEEWSHNFADNFIVKDPAVTRFVHFE